MKKLTLNIVNDTKIFNIGKKISDQNNEYITKKEKYFQRTHEKRM